jgi:salicylate hydroxylase
MQHFLISGGGIGGLCAALGLARAGRRVTVFERASAFGEIGAGIQLGPNAFYCFDALGVGDEARKIAVFVDKLRLMDAMTAEDICEIPLDAEFRKFFGNPYAVIHRGELHKILLNACKANKNIELKTNADVLTFDQDEKQVHITLKNGETHKGDALIGADGLWSNIRKTLLDDGAPLVTGHTTYRSVIPTEEMPEDLRWNAATLWAGPKCHIVHYPLSDWKSFNLVVTYHNDAPEPVAGKSVTHEEVAMGFTHVHPKAKQIIERGKDWKMWVLCDREPVTTWSKGRVTILGDAAHPTLQYLAQGACMAMEDGVFLANRIKEGGSIENAFKAYEAERTLRTAQVTLMSREIGRHIYHPIDGHAALRNNIMGAKTPQDWFNTINWLYGYKMR